MLGATVEQILDAAQRSGVQAIEWSSDGFLDSGDDTAAGNLMLKTLKAGLTIASYATLFRAGIHTREEFDRVMSTARSVQAPIIRLWAPPLQAASYAQIKTADAEFVDIARELGDCAGTHGFTLCFSPARNSVLNSWSRAAVLMDTIKHPFIKLAWEPAPDVSFDESMEIFSRISGHVGMVVSRSLAADGTIHSLCQRDEDWSLYLDAFDEQGGAPDMARYIVIRAFKDNCPDNLKSDVDLINYYSGQLRRYRRRRLL